MPAELGKGIRLSILLGAPLTKQNFERIGIPYLSRSCEVMVCDCTPWMGRSSVQTDADMCSGCSLVTVRNENDLADAIKRWTPQYALDFIGFSAKTRSIVRVLAVHRVRLIVQKTGAIPVPGIPLRIWGWLLYIWYSKIWPKVKAGAPKSDVIGSTVPVSYSNVSLIDKLIGLLRQRVQLSTVMRELDSFPDYIGLIAGEKSHDRFTSRSRPVIWIGSNDYHTFKKVKVSSEQAIINGIKGLFILFIDDCLVGAHDWALLSVPPPVSENGYYPPLCKCFERIEKEYGMPIVVAGHPNSESDDSYSEKMGGRKVVYGNTAALAIAANVVLIHASTATSFAVLARKPIISLTSRELDRSSYGPWIRAMSSALGSPLVIMDKPDSRRIRVPRPVVDEKKYRAYEYSYLRSERSTETEPWGALIEYIGSS